MKLCLFPHLSVEMFAWLHVAPVVFFFTVFSMLAWMKDVMGINILVSIRGLKSVGKTVIKRLTLIASGQEER